MGIVRLAKCLRILNSITEYNNRATDIKNKISGNRVYMDFVSIVYKIQTNVANELNYLLFSFILLKANMLNTTELLSNNFAYTIQKYKQCIKGYKHIERNNSIKQTTEQYLKDLNAIINDDFIDYFKNAVRVRDVMNQYVYQSVIEFIVDMLNNKLIDVEYLLIAFDGIPSFGKIQEQRQRRYMRHAYIEFQKLIETKSTDNKKPSNGVNKLRFIYDNDHFQIDIRSAIEYVYSMYHNATLEKDITIYVEQFRKSSNIQKDKAIEIEVINKPYGEGEKILMDRVSRDYQTFRDDKTYVFYSPDGDSVILCLYIYIKTKVNMLNVVKAYSMNPSNRHNENTQYVDIKILYNNIVHIIEKYTKNTYNLVKDRDNICTDFIILINLFGNDFIHQIPTMEISATIMDLMYIYAKFIRDHQYITIKIGETININHQCLKDFFIFLADFEQFTMLDTYMVDMEDKNKIFKYFGNIFTFRYLLDYSDSITALKKEIRLKIISGKSNIETIKKMVSDGINIMNNKITVTGNKYGDIWVKIEIKNISDYANKILTDPDFLIARFPKFIHNFRTKVNRNENDIKQLVNELEIDLIRSNKSINVDMIFSSDNKKIRDFAFDYGNIRVMVPHNQMPITERDIDLYLLEWKSGKWMNVLNSFSFEIGYDWQKRKSKNLNTELKRYQYDMLELSNTDINKMVINWLKTLSWMCDYYMNTEYESTTTEISTWSYNYDRSPFITHIANFMESITTNALKNIMKGVYKRSLVQFDDYLKPNKHQFYIYPQSSEIIKNIPEKNKINFPDMIEYVKRTVQLTNNTENKTNKQNINKNRVFDCRMCPYFSKCLFKNKHMTFKELNEFDLDSVKN